MARSGDMKYVVIAQHASGSTADLVGRLRQWGMLQQPSVVCVSKTADQSGLSTSLGSVLFGGNSVTLSVADESEPTDWWTEATRASNVRTALCVLPRTAEMDQVTQYFIEQGALQESESPEGLSIHALP